MELYHREFTRWLESMPKEYHRVFLCGRVILHRLFMEGEWEVGLVSRLNLVFSRFCLAGLVSSQFMVLVLVGSWENINTIVRQSGRCSIAFSGPSALYDLCAVVSEAVCAPVTGVLFCVLLHSTFGLNSQTSA